MCTTCREDVHGLAQLPSAPLVVAGQVHQGRVLVALGGEHAAVHEALRRNVTGAPSRRVKEVVEVGWVVLRQVGGLKAGEVSEQNPVPAGDHNVLCLDVTMANASAVRLIHSAQDLEGQPTFLHVVEERPRADAVVQVVTHVLPEENSGLLRQRGLLEGQAVVAGVQADLQFLQLLLVAGKWQRRVLDGKHLDHHEALTVLGPRHLEEARAAQALVILVVVDVGEVAVHRQDLGRGNAGQLVSHGAYMSMQTHTQTQARNSHHYNFVTARGIAEQPGESNSVKSKASNQEDCGFLYNNKNDDLAVFINELLFTGHCWQVILTLNSDHR